jgi:hypothetical protein
MDRGKMYSFGGNMTDSKGIALPVNVRFKETLCTMLRLQCQNHISPLFSNGFRNLVSTSSVLRMEHPKGVQAEPQVVVFRGQLTNGIRRSASAVSQLQTTAQLGLPIHIQKDTRPYLPFLTLNPNS